MFHRVKKHCQNCGCCLMLLFIAGREWVLRLLFSSVINVMSVSMFTSLFALWGCYIIVFVFFGQVLSPHHSETNIEHVCKFHISCIGASGCTGKMEKYFTRSLGSHTDSGWERQVSHSFEMHFHISARWYHVISTQVELVRFPNPLAFGSDIYGSWGTWLWWNMPFGFRSTLINWLLSLEPFNTKPTRYPKLPYRNCMPGR